MRLICFAYLLYVTPSASVILTCKITRCKNAVLDAIKCNQSYETKKRTPAMTITVDNPAFSQSADLPGGEEAAEFYSRYEPREVLGRGLVSVVRKCIHRATGDVFAVKIIDVGSEEGQKILDETKKEIEILKVLILSRFQPYSSQNPLDCILTFSVCAPPRPPQNVMLPQLQSTCHYMVGHYVKM